jgi:ABC-type dipeptide/oligopeptide/nickel transport system permease subunit
MRIVDAFLFFPGMAITATVLAFHMLGDGIRDGLDPRSEGKRRDGVYEK